MSNVSPLIPLNRSEYMCLASEGYVGHINQPYLLRFDGPVEVAALRQAFREMTSAFPRMRAVMTATLRRYALQVLPDDLYVDQLFDDAFRVRHGVDPSSSEALEAFHNEILNEPISMEKGLPWRAWVLPHPQSPAVMFNTNHLLGDGRSMTMLLTALMGRLNGKPIQHCPLEITPQTPAIKPLHWWQWPQSIMAALRNARRDKEGTQGEHVVSLTSRRSPRFTTAGIVHHTVSADAKAVRAVAKQMGTTVNTLLMAALAETFLALEKDRPQVAAVIRSSVDLRPFFPDGKGPQFGNFAAAFTVRARRQRTLAEQIQSLEKQAKDHVQRFKQHDNALPLLAMGALSWVGRRLYTYTVLQMKARGKIPPTSCHMSNLGSVDFINPPEARLRLKEFWPATVGPIMMVGVLSMNGRLLMPVIYQRDETDLSAVRLLLKAFDQRLAALIATPQPAEAPQPA